MLRTVPFPSVGTGAMTTRTYFVPGQNLSYLTSPGRESPPICMDSSDHAEERVPANRGACRSVFLNLGEKSPEFFSWGSRMAPKFGTHSLIAGSISKSPSGTRFWAATQGSIITSRIRRTKMRFTNSDPAIGWKKNVRHSPEFLS